MSAAIKAKRYQKNNAGVPLWPSHFIPQYIYGGESIIRHEDVEAEDHRMAMIYGKKKTISCLGKIKT